MSWSESTVLLSAVLLLEPVATLLAVFATLATSCPLGSALELYADLCPARPLLCQVAGLEALAVV